MDQQNGNLRLIIFFKKNLMQVCTEQQVYCSFIEYYFKNGITHANDKNEMKFQSIW